MKKQTKLNAYLQLIRLPNLFTIPGDVLIGGFLVTTLPMYTVKSSLSIFMSALALILISLLLYSFGLVQNDLVGFKEDCELGRKRPLTTGRISKREAQVFALLLCLAALVGSLFINATAVMLTALILGFVTLYNYLNRAGSLLSPLVMGMCRGLNILLGASLVGWNALSFEAWNQYLWICVVFHILYILSVTVFARNEATTGPKSYAKLAPFVMTLLFAMVTTNFYFGIFAFVTLLTTLPILKKSTPQEIGKTVGSFIQNLILLQMVWLMLLDLNFLVVGFVLGLYLLHGRF
ncbi:MAG: UbiA family prenyltransferase, partial [Lentisphaeria bacterium]|nr:UbiA family prenyltransferase [Lentisphaeria bacterium]